MKGEIKIKLHRGELCASIEELAERWGWTCEEVRTFLDELERDGKITRRAKTMADERRRRKARRYGYEIITIVNYDEKIQLAYGKLGFN